MVTNKSASRTEPATSNQENRAWSASGPDNAMKPKTNSSTNAGVTNRPDSPIVGVMSPFTISVAMNRVAVDPKTPELKTPRQGRYHAGGQQGVPMAAVHKPSTQRSQIGCTVQPTQRPENKDTHESFPSPTENPPKSTSPGIVSHFDLARFQGLVLRFVVVAAAASGSPSRFRCFSCFRGR